MCSHYNVIRAGSLVCVVAILAATWSRADDDVRKEIIIKSPPRGRDSAHEALRFLQSAHGDGLPYSHSGLPYSHSKYWLNIRVSPVPRALVEQLQLKDKAGVLVEHVGEGGPADQAGLKQHDIILSVGDKPVKDLAQLGEMVDAADGAALSFNVLRAGQPTKIAVTAEKRPELPRFDQLPEELADLPEIRAVEKSIRENLEKLKGVANLRLQLVKPGTPVPPGGKIALREEFALPEGVNITIHKEGKDLAEIEVKQGDKTWKVKSNELDQLPDELRGSVEGMLGGRPVHWRILSEERSRGDVEHHRQQRRQDYERRLAQVSARLRELLANVEALQREGRQDAQHEEHEEIRKEPRDKSN